MKKEKVKICFFYPSSYAFFSKNKEINHGGAELQMFLLANKLSENEKFKITFLVGNYGQEKISNYNKIELVKSFNLQKTNGVFYKITKAVKLFFLLIKIKPDIIFTTGANSIVSIISFYKKVFKKKHIHRTAHLYDVNKLWIENNGMVGKLYKYGLVNADKIITQNEEHKEFLLKNHLINAEVIRNGFEINNIQQFEKENILWVGRFETWKNPDSFLKLAGIFNQYNFIMICPYDETDYKEWNLFQNKAKLLSNLTFIKQVPFFEIQDYFNKAIVFVNTSSAEGFPNTFLQAAMARTPIVSLNVNPENFLYEYNCGIFCNNDFDYMVKQLKSLLNNKKELQDKGENCYSYLENKHDINIVGDHLEQIIYDLK